MSRYHSYWTGRETLGGQLTSSISEALDLARQRQPRVIICNSMGAVNHLRQALPHMWDSIACMTRMRSAAFVVYDRS
jgi:hypothetical protein